MNVVVASPSGAGKADHNTTPGSPHSTTSSRPSPASPSVRAWFSVPFNACRLCDKAVYVADGVFLNGASWHKSCFRCGALGDVGCKRVLHMPSSPPYFHYYGNPFCHGCTGRYFLNGRPIRFIVHPDAAWGARCASSPLACPCP